MGGSQSNLVSRPCDTVEEAKGSRSSVWGVQVPVAAAANWDVIVIGGGVVGCAVLRELTLRGWRALLVEALPHLCAGASSGNTGIACTASDVTPGTLEHQCLQDAHTLNLPTYHALQVPHRPTGAMYVAYSDVEVAALREERRVRMERGDATPVLLTGPEAREKDAALDAGVVGALYLPGETVVDPWLVPLAWARHAHENGGVIWRGVAVVSAKRHDADGTWCLGIEAYPSSTGTGGALASTSSTSVHSTSVHAPVMVACGGLRGDDLERLHRSPPFAIRPRRGDFVLLDEETEKETENETDRTEASATAARVVGQIPVGQVPSATSRGVYVWRSAHGVLACGPTAEDVEARDTPPSETTPTVRQQLHAAAIKAFPHLRAARVVGTYAGLRPGSDAPSKDYQIEATAGGWVTVGGIRSTGLTASLGIARHVAGLCEACCEGALGRCGPPPRPRTEIRTTPLPPVTTLVASFVARGDGCVVFGDDALGFGPHRVTHPLTRAGFERLARQARE